MIQIIDEGSHSTEQAVNLCMAEISLTQIYVKQGKLDLARTSSENAYRGLKRHVGKEDSSCHDALALVSKVYELQGNAPRARAYLAMIPSDVRDAISSRYSTLKPVQIISPKKQGLKAVRRVTTLKEYQETVTSLSFARRIIAI